MNEITIKLDGVEYSEKDALMIAGVLGEMTYREVCQAISTARGLGCEYIVEIR